MIRTQIYLTQEEIEQLARLAHAIKRSQSALIRDAIDSYLQHSNTATQQHTARSSRNRAKESTRFMGKSYRFT